MIEEEELKPEVVEEVNFDALEAALDDDSMSAADEEEFVPRRSGEDEEDYEIDLAFDPEDHDNW